MEILDEIRALRAENREDHVRIFDKLEGINVRTSILESKDNHSSSTKARIFKVILVISAAIGSFAVGCALRYI